MWVWPLPARRCLCPCHYVPVREGIVSWVAAALFGSQQCCGHGLGFEGLRVWGLRWVVGLQIEVLVPGKLFFRARLWMVRGFKCWGYSFRHYGCRIGSLGACLVSQGCCDQLVGMWFGWLPMAVWFSEHLCGWWGVLRGGGTWSGVLVAGSGVWVLGLSFGEAWVVLGGSAPPIGDGLVSQGCFVTS